jgi:hypothetical protein
MLPMPLQQPLPMVVMQQPMAMLLQKVMHQHKVQKTPKANQQNIFFEWCE